jgi:hypothetical protein
MFIFGETQKKNNFAPNARTPVFDEFSILRYVLNYGNLPNHSKLMKVM